MNISTLHTHLESRLPRLLTLGMYFGSFILIESDRIGSVQSEKSVGFKL